MQHGSDIIVVGAGIVGSSAAYHLADLGETVTLIEQTILAPFSPARFRAA